ncbi:MAG: hypothetical protein K2K72_01995, partial [Duncaniella sp.]|nr:hypothetical protein [Duncaniella sp.]
MYKIKILDKWSVGAQGSYRAEIASRDRDPRLRAVVSDLCVEAGCTRRISGSYIVGVKGALDIYRQNCDLTFYNPINDINTYPLTGLGTVYRRFAGNSNEATGYQADGVRAGAQVIPTGDHGFNCSIDYFHERLEQRLRDYNNLTLARVAHSSIEGLLSYTFRLNSGVGVVPSVKVVSDTRRGSENLFGTAIGSGYDVIGERDNYRRSCTLVSASVPGEFSRGASRLFFTPSVTGTKVSCRVIDVDRRVSVSGLTPGLLAGYSAVVRQGMILQGGLSVDYTFNDAPASGNNLETQLPDITETGLAQSVLSNYDMLRADRRCVALQCG